MDDKPTFKNILAQAAADNALALERKARLASWLAKAYPERARKFYQVKHAAIGQLFRIPGYNPRIRRAELTAQHDVMLFIRYARSRWLQHVRLSQLEQAAPGKCHGWAKTFVCRCSSLTSSEGLPGSANLYCVDLSDPSCFPRQSEHREGEAHLE